MAMEHFLALPIKEYDLYPWLLRYRSLGPFFLISRAVSGNIMSYVVQDSASPEALDFMKKCLVVDPSGRSTASSLLDVRVALPGESA